MIRKFFILALSLWLISAVGCRFQPLTKTPIDSSYEVRELVPASGLGAFDSRFVRAACVDSSPLEVENLLNQIQKEYRVYIRSTSDIKIDFDFNGPLIEELQRLAILYDLDCRVEEKTVFVYDNGRAPQVVCLPFNLSSEEISAATLAFPDLKFFTFRNSILIQGPMIRVADFVACVPSRSDDLYLMSIVLLNVENKASVDLAARLNFSSVDLISKGLSLYDVFEAYGAIDASADNSLRYFEQQIYLSLGQKASYNFGSEIQRESRAITDQGTSTVSGYQSFRDGVEVTATINRDADDLLVDLTFDRSKFSDLTALSRTQNKIEYTRLKVRPNRLYYLTQFSEQEEARGSGFLRYFTDASNRSTLVWFAVFPISATKIIDEKIKKDVDSMR